MYRKMILDRLEQTLELPTSLAVSVEVQRLTSDPRSSIDQIANVLRNDPVLTAKVLKLANSALFAQTKRIVSINQAITVLGLAEFGKITSTITFLNAFKSQFINYDTYWLHSLATAFIANKINSICRASINDERVFTGALLHDIGILILDNYFTGLYKKVFEISHNNKFELSRVESSILGINHAEVGAFMLRKWRLPNEITDIIQNHHKPQFAEIVQTDAKLVYIANFIACNRGYNNGDEAFLEGFYEDIWDDLGLTVEDVPEIIDSIDTEVDKARQLLRLGGI